ncbi:MAG: divalent-cation tolerance protein CutA [Candidatus Thorarchaeota archaeon]|nr:divalent-cation tolerance protein CutA [Candidatus Thorarchaeota archaeon]
MSDFIVAITTCPIEVAQNLARVLVEAKVCACVNIIPSVKSIYHWKGEIVTDNEALLVMKTKADLASSLEEVIKRIHPYEVPEYVVLRVEKGAKDYLDWITETTKSV